MRRPGLTVIAAAFGAVALKTVFAVRLPLLFDEAYFATWGRYLDVGSYDHPQMVSWLHRLLSYVGDSDLIIRLPALLFPAAVSIILYLLLRTSDPQKAAWAALLLLASPLDLLHIFITTDTPLYLCSFASLALLYRALRDDRWLDYLLSGFMLSCGYMCKYFAALLGAAYLAYFLARAREPKHLKGLLLLVGACVPFIAYNLYWNSQHCWTHLMFNFFNRNEGEKASALKVLIYLAEQLYLLTPPLLVLGIRRRHELLARIREPLVALFAFAIAVPLGLDLLLSVWKVIGLHWTLSFYPAAYALAFFVVSAGELRRATVWMAAFSGVQLVAAGVLIAFPREQILSSQLLKRLPKYGELVALSQTERILQELAPYRDRFVVTAMAYSQASLLTWKSHILTPVYGYGGYHARMDDAATDFSKLAGKDLLVFSPLPPRDDELAPYFDRYERRSISIAGTTFHLTLGYGFKFIPYREQVLRFIQRRYYAFPPFLPHPPGTCLFLDRYFPKG